jgi:hypothetical protein
MIVSVFKHSTMSRSFANIVSAENQSSCMTLRSLFFIILAHHAFSAATRNSNSSENRFSRGIVEYLITSPIILILTYRY